MGAASQPPDTRPSLLSSARRYAWRILAATVVVALLAGWLSSQRRPTFEAVTSLVLDDPANAGVFETAANVDPEQYVPQRANLAGSRVVLQRAADKLGESREELERQVEVQADVELAELAISAAADDPNRAAALANAVADAFEAETREQNLSKVEAASEIIQEQITQLRAQVRKLEQRVASSVPAQVAGGWEPADPTDVAAGVVADSRLATLTSELVSLETRANEIAANAVVFGSGVQLRESALPPERPVSPFPLRDGIIGAVVALVVALAVAYWRAGAQNKVESRGEPGRILGVPLLGEVPLLSKSSRGTIDGLSPGSEASEAYEFVLSSIEFSLAEIDASSVLITSASPGEGKTSTALHVALASAREGRRVLLVDGDIRVRGLSNLLHAGDGDGLTSMANGEAGLAEALRQYRVSETVQLSFMPAGPTPNDSIGLIRSEGFKQTMEHLKAESQLAIFDSSPLLPVADASVLGAQVGGIVLVVDRDTEREQLEKVRERLAFVSTPLLGYVYNRAPLSKSTRYGYGPRPPVSHQGGWRRVLPTTSGVPESVGSNGNAGARV